METSCLIGSDFLLPHVSLKQLGTNTLIVRKHKRNKLLDRLHFPAFSSADSLFILLNSTLGRAWLLPVLLVVSLDQFAPCILVLMLNLPEERG